MDIRIEGFYERLLLRIAAHHQEPTATGVIRNLLRKEARENGLWLVDEGQERESEDEVAHSPTEG